MDLEAKITSVAMALLVVERIATKAYVVITERRRACGSNLHRAFKDTGGVLNELYKLYQKLEQTEGFHSLRMLSAHNSGHDLSETMLWKGTVLATFPHDADMDVRWDEQPLDPEYIHRILRPVTEDGTKLCYTSELSAHGALGALCRTKQIGKCMYFLVKKSDSEIVFTSVAFRAATAMDPEQSDAIRECKAAISNLLRT